LKSANSRNRREGLQPFSVGALRAHPVCVAVFLLGPSPGCDSLPQGSHPNLHDMHFWHFLLKK
jgi:hypothetical protein